MAEAAKKTEQEAPAEGVTVSLRGEYEILTESPLEDFASPPALAYAARHARGGDKGLFALICDPKLPYRTEYMKAFKRLEHMNLLQLQDSGAVDWTPENRRCMALIYERPHGGRLMNSVNDQIQPMAEDAVMSLVIEPMVNVLALFADLRVPHRGIRPTNMFWRTASGGELALGDALSGPAGVAQPVICETIENGMAHPAGRGLGAVPDDLYSLGVTLALLLMGHNPLAKANDQEVVRQKLDIGSYNALVGNYRVSLSMMEVLRGLLQDDAEDRWTVEDLGMWLAGRRQTPRQSQIPRRTQRGFQMAGTNYFSLRGLAHGFCTHWSAGTTAVRQAEFENWVARSVLDVKYAERILEARTRGGAGGSLDRLLANVCITLDPQAPVRFKDFGVKLDGLGPALAAAMTDDSLREMFTEVISGQLVTTWLVAQKPPPPELTQIVQRIDKINQYLTNAAIGYGIERCLYELNPTLPCQSPLIEGDFVDEVENVLPALERAAMRSPRPAEPFDRHIAAYLAARSKVGVSADLRRVADRDRGTSVLGILHILASQQSYYSVGALPKLASWLGDLMKPVIAQYNSTRLRADIEAGLPGVMRSGNLSDLAQLVDNSQVRRQDRTGYERACARFEQIERHLAMVKQQNVRRSEIAEAIGGQVAVGISSVLASVGSLLITLAYLI